MDQTGKIGLTEAIEVIHDLLREHLRRTKRMPGSVIAVGGTALAILNIRERSEDIDLYLSEVDDGAVDATVKRFRSRYGLNFKVDVTPANTLWGAFAVKDIEESPIAQRISVDEHAVEIRVLSPETLYLLKAAADRPKDRRDLELIAIHCDYTKLVGRAKRLLPWFGDRSAFPEYVERLLRVIGRDFGRSFWETELALGLGDVVLERVRDIRSGLELQFWQILRAALIANAAAIRPHPSDPKHLTFDVALLREELREMTTKDPQRFSDLLAETLKQADSKRYIEWLSRARAVKKQ
jgi:hypothetical protein